MISIKTTTIDGESKYINYEHRVDKCPFCHNGIVPIELNAYINERFNDLRDDDISYVIYKCPRNECNHVFIGIYKFVYKLDGRYFKGPIGVYPVFPMDQIFNDAINNISTSFVKIYNQAYSAEHHKLDLIAGPGYRKALEFLIKDYALSKSDENTKDDILQKSLAVVINSFIDDSRIKSIAKRAAWLGNDETHYFRKWEGKDLKELKLLIELTVRWIEMVELSNEYVKDMPD